MSDARLELASLSTSVPETDAFTTISPIRLKSHQAITNNALVLQIVIFVELVPFNPMVFPGLVNDPTPIVLHAIYLAYEMSINDIVEYLAQRESVQ